MVQGTSPPVQQAAVPHIENLHEEVAPNTTDSDPTHIDPHSLQPMRVQFKVREPPKDSGPFCPIPPPAKEVSPKLSTRDLRYQVSSSLIKLSLFINL